MRFQHFYRNEIQNAHRIEIYLTDVWNHAPDYFQLRFAEINMIIKSRLKVNKDQKGGNLLRGRKKTIRIRRRVED